MNLVEIEVDELTPRGSGAVSVLRVRGKDAVTAVLRLCGGANLGPGGPRTVRLRIGAEDLDEAIVCELPTGEVEIHVHGSPAVVRRLRTLLEGSSSLPARLRHRTTLEERAAGLLATAPCESAARILLDQAEGALRRELGTLAAEAPDGRVRGVERLLRRWEIARWALEPAEVVIAGPANAGKSTLFNALLGEVRAIVAPEPGTTRDRLRARALLGAWPVWISDTAGEREPVSEVEKEGRERARRARASADLLLWLVPVFDETPAEIEPRAVLVRSFADRCRETADSRAISALRDPGEARERVAAIFRDSFSLPSDPWIPGAGVPVSREQAEAVMSLRASTGLDFERALAALLDAGAE